ncbi:hypothetical protein [Streptomyces sp. NPDC048568]
MPPQQTHYTRASATDSEQSIKAVDLTIVYRTARPGVPLVTG